MGSQAGGLLCNSRGQVRLRRTPPPDGDATEPPDPERVVYSLWRVRRGAYSTPAGSDGMGVGVSVGGVPPWRDLPAATVGQPFRLHQGTARQSCGRQPADPLRQPPTGLAPGALKTARGRKCHAPRRLRPFFPFHIRFGNGTMSENGSQRARRRTGIPSRRRRTGDVQVEGDRSKDRPRENHTKEAIS